MGATAARVETSAPVHPVAQALLIGPAPDEETLLRLFSRSHWTLEQEAGLAQAVPRLARESFPVVFCGIADWQRTAAATRALGRPPVVIALTEEPGCDGELEAIASDVYCICPGRMAPRELFSLLNHAWRVRNER